VFQKNNIVGAITEQPVHGFYLLTKCQPWIFLAVIQNAMVGLHGCLQYQISAYGGVNDVFRVKNETTCFSKFPIYSPAMRVGLIFRRFAKRKYIQLYRQNKRLPVQVTLIRSA